MDTCQLPIVNQVVEARQSYVIRLITQLLFVWFLKEKKLVPERIFCEEYAHRTLKYFSLDRVDYYCAILWNLFYATLNTPVNQRQFFSDKSREEFSVSRYNFEHLLNDPQGLVNDLKMVPFVNGGLFEYIDDFSIVVDENRLEQKLTDLHVPAKLFFGDGFGDKGIFAIFRDYKFTVEENTPIDQEVALDPELLGRAFEHLLGTYNPETESKAKNRNVTGSFYTPRNVVDYLVRESLSETILPMVIDEGSDIEWHRDQLLYLFDHSVAPEDAIKWCFDGLCKKKELIERKKIVSAISKLRTIDPAVGSGAFPMGILQVLTLALRRLDPNNEIWKEVQREKIHNGLNKLLTTEDIEKQESLLWEMKQIFNKYSQSDYGRKLYLIQNCIYGVDIQTIACQIAKLRFFISLIIEQDYDDNAENYGIQPLPNLESHFVATDTLLGLSCSVQMNLFDEAPEIKLLKEKLELVRKKHFTALTHEEKKAYRDSDRKLREQLACKLEDLNFLSESDARKIAEWDPYNQQQSSNWFDSAYMFGVDSGFDLVIGNPPYIKLGRDHGAKSKLYKNSGYQSFAGKGDVYLLFYEQGCKMLKSQVGILAFITSNSWLKAVYGEKLRDWFTQNHTPLRLVEMGTEIFDADVDTNILVVRSGGEARPFPAIASTTNEHFKLPDNQWDKVFPSESAPWVISSDIELCIQEKIYNNRNIPLKDWSVRIRRGITTNCNEAFIIDGKIRKNLIETNPRAGQLIHAILRGGNIKRWRGQFSDQWLISTTPQFQGTVDAPALTAHLQHYGRENPMTMRGGYYAETTREKLIWKRVSEFGCFAYDTSGILSLDSTFIITGKNLKAICAVLNSNYTTWYFRKIAPTTGMGVPRWDKPYVSLIPIPQLLIQEECNLIEIVDWILKAKDQSSNADVSEQEKELNEIIYRMLDLNKKQIREVESKIQ